MNRISIKMKLNLLNNSYNSSRKLSTYLMKTNTAIFREMIKTTQYPKTHQINNLIIIRHINTKRMIPQSKSYKYQNQLMNTRFIHHMLINQRIMKIHKLTNRDTLRRIQLNNHNMKNTKSIPNHQNILK